MTVSFAGDLLNYLKIASSYIECLTDCWTCLNSTTCSKCLPGYYLREGEIQSCEGKKHHWLATNILVVKLNSVVIYQIKLACISVYCKPINFRVLLTFAIFVFI